MKSFLKYFLVFHLNDKFPVQVKQVFEVIEKQSKATSFYDFSSSVLKEIFTSPLFELILSAEITMPQVFYLKLMSEVVLSQGYNTNDQS